MKKILSVVLASLFVFCGISSNLTKGKAFTESNIRYVGDVNKDGKVDGVDASEILTSYAKLSIEGDSAINELEVYSNRYIADVNNDGKIDGVDASRILTSYAVSSVGGTVEYEIIWINGKNNRPVYNSQDVLRFIGQSWNVHTSPELTIDNMYPEKSKLLNQDIFYVVGKENEEWYKVIVDSSETPVYILSLIHI